MSKSKTELEQELRDLDLKRAAIETELAAAEDPNKPNVLRRDYFNSLTPQQKMDHVRAGIELID